MTTAGSQQGAVESCDETKTVFGLPCRCIVKGEHYVHDWDSGGR